jgi:hypothetical protein
LKYLGANLYGAYTYVEGDRSEKSKNALQTIYLSVPISSKMCELVIKHYFMKVHGGMDV